MSAANDRFFPAFSQYRDLARNHELVPVALRISCDTQTLVSAFHGFGLNREVHSFLLESVSGGQQVSRYSFLGGDPLLTVCARGNRVTVTDFEQGTSRAEIADDPLAVLEKVLTKHSLPPIPGFPPFHAGAVGYIAYDYVRQIEPVIGSPRRRDGQVPDLLFMFPRFVAAFDHAFQSLYLVVNTRPKSGPAAAYRQAVSELERLAARLKRPEAVTRLPAYSRRAFPTDLPRSSFTKDAYMAAVRKIKEHIAAGDIFQAVPSQRFETPANFEPLSLYRVLRMTNPSPYMFYLRFPEVQLVGASPEVMVRVRGREALVRPIAGTRPRGQTPEEDRELAAELLQDEKELAEHMMLVDLGRNDLGRVCKYGTVRVRELKVVERYSHVMHIVSEVAGTLRPGVTSCGAVRATFPAGTVSGAPKIRAMQILDAVEPVPRGPYAGLVGYFNLSGDADTCITIRTVVITGDKARIQAGGGVVADSDPEKEYQETLNKAAAMLSAIEAVRRPYDRSQVGDLG